MHGTHTSDTAAAIRALAARLKIAYVETATDILGHHITRLAGDDVELDETQRLLIALERAGSISGRDAVRLHVAYLNERNP
jgi:hypothetical protein